jgi:hypothetical protein
VSTERSKETFERRAALRQRRFKQISAVWRHQHMAILDLTYHD